MPWGKLLLQEQKAWATFSAQWWAHSWLTQSLIINVHTHPGVNMCRCGHGTYSLYTICQCCMFTRVSTIFPILPFAAQHHHLTFFSDWSLSSNCLKLVSLHHAFKLLWSVHILNRPHTTSHVTQKPQMIHHHLCLHKWWISGTMFKLYK